MTKEEYFNKWKLKVLSNDRFSPLLKLSYVIIFDILYNWENNVGYEERIKMMSYRFSKDCNPLGPTTNYIDKIMGLTHGDLSFKMYLFLDDKCLDDLDYVNSLINEEIVKSLSCHRKNILIK